jgi:hypothetical protein
MKLPALGPAGILSDFIYDFLAFSPKKNALLQESYTSNKIRAQLQVFREAMEEAIPKGENSLGDDLVCDLRFEFPLAHSLTSSS